jgi:hypothetical protein
MVEASERRWKPLTFSQGSGAFRRRGRMIGLMQALAMVVGDLLPSLETLKNRGTPQERLPTSLSRDKKS